jgi:PASTA domain
MTTSQPNLLQLAKQGDVTAIATLINRQLEPKGITAKVSLKGSTLQVMLEAEQVPDQKALVAFVRKGVTSLAVKAIERVKVYGRQVGEDFPEWSNEFDLVEPNQLSDQSSLPTATNPHNSGLRINLHTQKNLNDTADAEQKLSNKVSSDKLSSNGRKIHFYSSNKISNTQALTHLQKLTSLKGRLLSDDRNKKKIACFAGGLLLPFLTISFLWNAYTTAKVPSVVGQESTYAAGILKGQGFEVETVEKVEEDVKPGQVLEQQPNPESNAKKGSKIKLIVAKLPVYKVQGEFILIDSNIRKAFDTCFETGGYEDIEQNMPVTIRDGKENILATGNLGKGITPQDAFASVECKFEFSLDSVPKSDFYVIEIGHRGKLNYSFEEMQKRNWTVSFSLS